MSAPTQPVDHQQLLRQQLILAQARILDLEDLRDELQPRIATLESLLREAQQLADTKAEQADHLERARADLQAQYEHMRHMQHVTNTALEGTRAQLAAASESIARLEQAQSGLLLQLGHTHDELGHAHEHIRGLRADAAALTARVSKLDAERRAMQNSRSWRWTAWLRGLERALARRP
ncbi:MAG: hypothetical protein IT582_09225 [Opitutaceae bacterium]|nr:hypothetical protein [Opitutaceae bacterium]